MPFKITYYDETTEDVAADGYSDGKDWIDFYTVGSIGGHEQVLRIRANEVTRIQKI